MNRKEFINFVKNLRVDFIKNNAQWENKTIEDYLESMSAYVEDIDGYYKSTNQEVNLEKIDWEIFADILKGSSIYE